MTHSAETSFLLQACHPGLADHLDSALMDIPDDFDWTVLVQTALDHGVSGLMCRNLLKSNSKLIPEEILKASGDHLAHQTEINQKHADQLAMILDHLDQSKINAIPFKGPTLAMAAYGDIALRSFGDLDFLIKLPDVQHCLDVLRDTGYSHDWDLTPRQWQEFVNYAGEDILFGPGLPIEPHWAFAPSTLALKLDYQKIWQRSKSVKFNNRQILSLSTEDELIVLCIHGCKEEWVKLKWVADIAGFIQLHPDLNWEQVFDLASKQGVARIVRLGLLLVKHLLDFAYEKNIGKWMAQDLFAEQWSRQIADDFFTVDKSDLDIWKPGYFHWHMREKLSDRLRYYWRTISQPRVQYFEDISFPDRLFFLYWPYRLLHDYVALPIWKLVKK
jgi:hypothetical protein